MTLHAPSFWNRPPGLVTAVLSPLEKIVRLYGKLRLRRRAAHVSVPVVCCGNITVGGTGKTPLTLHLARLLQMHGRKPHIITRGYKGRSKRQGRVFPHDNASDYGDEAILLARQAPTWRGRNRFLSAQNAIAHGADCLIMDDGLQSPVLHKDFSILVIDGPSGLGNGRILPAGPLRETLDTALSRIRASVIIGQDNYHLASYFPPHIPVFKAELVPGPEIRQLVGKQCIAFSGIGRPEKFFTTLREAGLNIIRTLSFPDHHMYTQRDLSRLSRLACLPGVALVTTEKDAVKLPQDFIKSVTVISVDLLWQNESDPQYILRNII